MALSRLALLPLALCGAPFVALLAGCSVQVAVARPPASGSAGPEESETLATCGPRPAASSRGLVLSAEVAGREASARRKALAKALVEGLGPVLGLDISSTLRISDSAVTRQGRTVEESEVREDSEVRFGATRVKEYKVAYCALPSGRLRADVSLAQAEVARLKRVARNATLLVLQCASEAEGACTPDLRDRARSLVQKSGPQVAEVSETPEDPSLGEVQAKALAAAASTAVVVRLSAPAVGKEGSYRVCRAQVSASVIDAEEGKSLREVKPKGYGADGAYKGVVYADRGDDAAACRKAFLEALGALEEELGSEADSAGL